MRLQKVAEERSLECKGKKRDVGDRRVDEDRGARGEDGRESGEGKGTEVEGEWRGKGKGSGRGGTRNPRCPAPLSQGRLLAGERAKNTEEQRNDREERKRQWNVSRRACVAPWNAAP